MKLYIYIHTYIYCNLLKARATALWSNRARCLPAGSSPKQSAGSIFAWLSAGGLHAQRLTLCGVKPGHFSEPPSQGLPQSGQTPSGFHPGAGKTFKTTPTLCSIPSSSSSTPPPQPASSPPSSQSVWIPGSRIVSVSYWFKRLVSCWLMALWVWSNRIWRKQKQLHQREKERNR